MFSIEFHKSSTLCMFGSKLNFAQLSHQCHFAVASPGSMHKLCHAVSLVGGCHLCDRLWHIGGLGGVRPFLTLHQGVPTNAFLAAGQLGLKWNGDPNQGAAWLMIMPKLSFERNQNFNDVWRHGHCHQSLSMTIFVIVICHHCHGHFPHHFHL